MGDININLLVNEFTTELFITQNTRNHIFLGNFNLRQSSWNMRSWEGRSCNVKQ